MCNLIDKWFQLQAKDQEICALKRRIAELERPMPCSHPARYTFPPTGDSGTTHFCLACEYFSRRFPIGQDESWMLTHITDDFGNYWPRLCPICQAPMVIIRPGDCRCSGEEH